MGFVTDLGTGVFQPRSLAQPINSNRACAEAGIDAAVCSWRAPPAIVDYCVAQEELSAETRRLVPPSGFRIASAARCDLAQALAEAAVLTAEAMLPVGGVCAPFKAPRVEMLTTSSAGYEVRFRVSEPNRTFDAVRSRDLSVRNMDLRQVTTYGHFESCAPPSIGAELCACQGVVAE